jgi:outer membrane protein OmpA-like peptidoglycan-associated protein
MNMKTLLTRESGLVLTPNLSRKSSLTIMAVALITAGCASTSSAPPSLVEARANVSSAASNPNVLANAPLELKRANDALARAEQSQVKGDEVDVDHNSYIATQRARTAMAGGNAKAAEDQIKLAELERERARGDAREREAQRAQVAASNARADARDARADANFQRDQAANAQAQTAGAQQQALIAQRDAANSASDAAAAKNQAAASDAHAASLSRQLAVLEALKTERGMVITLGDVLFEFNRSEVKPTAQARMSQLADFLKQYPDRRVSIEGHTDNIGALDYNTELSQRRAEAIKSQLVGMGVTGDRIATVGYGKSFPVASNDTDTNRAINRRVEVVISEPGQVVRSRV